jgi:hypothetical protein
MEKDGSCFSARGCPQVHSGRNVVPHVVLLGFHEKSNVFGSRTNVVIMLKALLEQIQHAVAARHQIRAEGTTLVQEI